MSSKESSNNNHCLVCLEPLSVETVGAVVPCGHCLHVKCWDGWTASRPAWSAWCSTGLAVKCPMCNSASTGFVRLFCDFGAATMDDDDEWSQSSNEEGENDPNDGLGPFNETVEECQSQDNTENGNDQALEIIVLDDDDDDDGPGAHASNASTTMVSTATAGMKISMSHTDKVKKYKRKAKQMKERLSQLQADLKQHGIEKGKLIEQVKAQKDALDELDELALSREGCLRKVEHLQLQLTQLKRQHTETSEKLSTAQREAAQWQREKERYQQKVAQASAASLKEVQQLLQEHPRVKAENQELKQLLQKYRRRLILAETRAPSSVAPQMSQPNKMKRLTKDMLRSIGEIHNAADTCGRRSEPKTTIHPSQRTRREAVATEHLDPQRKPESKTASVGIDTSKLSNHAVRMCRPMKTSVNFPSAAAMFNADPPPKLPDVLVPSKKKRAPNQGLADAARRKQKKNSAVANNFFYE